MSKHLKMALVAAGLAMTALPAAAADWSGVYVGLNAGTQNQTEIFSGFTENVTQTTNVTVPGRGVVVVPATTAGFVRDEVERRNGAWGAQLGWNGQAGNLVFGAELAAQSGAKEVTTTQTFALGGTILLPAGTVAVSRSVDVDTIWMAKARIGWGMDRTLLYADAGLAGARLNVSASDTVTNPGGVSPGGVSSNPFNNSTSGKQNSSMRGNGWTAGVGGEFKLNDHVAIGLDFSHTDLGRDFFTPTSTVAAQNVAFTAPAGTTASAAPTRVGSLASSNVRYRNDAVTVRFSYHFGGM